MGYLMASNQPSEQIERVDGWVRWYLMASNKYQISPSGHMSYERASRSARADLSDGRNPYLSLSSGFLWKGSSGFRPMRSYEEAVAAASLVTAVGITSRSALLETAEAEDRPDAASFGQLSRHDEQALLLRAR